MKETLGSVHLLQQPSIERNHDRNPLFSTLLQESLDQGNHDRNPWFSTLLQHPSIKEIMMETLGALPYSSISGPRKS